MLESRLFKKVEPVKHTEHTIQRLIAKRYLNQAKYLMPNIHYAFSRVEADMLLVRRGSGYVEEFEIKLSTSDFKADANKTFKHMYYLDLWEDKRNPKKFYFPNRFSYVIGPDVDMSKIEVPVYAGLFRVSNYNLICEKSPPLLHKNKNDWTEKIAKSANFRYLKAVKLIGRL